MKKGLIYGLMLLATLVSLWAQGERGTLNGIVTDASGSVVPGAAVSAVNVETNVESQTTSTEAGVYRLPYMAPGIYKVSVSKPGFQGAVRENIILRVAQTLTVDFTLQVGAVTEQVTVSSDPPLLETSNSEIGNYVSKKEFDTWPITVGDGRRQIQQFIFTSLPGTVGGTFEGSINGGQFYSHEILIEGIALGRMDLQGGSNNEFSPSADSVSEFKLQTGVVGANYSGGQTSVANFVTKSGTNELHGSGYFYIQNDALRANGYNNNANNIKRQPFKQDNYGYTVGGPIYLPKVYDGRNRSFFFHNLEKTRVRNFVSTTFSTLPVVDFKRGDFSRLFSPAFTGNAASGTMVGTDANTQPVRFGAIYDPTSAANVGGRFTRTVFPNNIVPLSRFDPVARKVLDLAPITDPSVDTMLNNIPQIGTSSPVFGETMLTFKGDHQINAGHRMSGLFNRNFRARNNSPGGRWGIPPGTPTNVYQWQETPGTLARLAYDWTVKPTVLNHAAIGYNRFGNLNQSVYIDQDWPSKIGVQNVPGTHFPALIFAGQPYQGGGIGGGGRLGSTNAGGSYNGSTIIQDDMTIIRGSHNFKLGFEQRRYYYNSRGRGNESGTFNFSPNQTAQPGFTNQTGHSFASFLLGSVATANRNVVASYFGHRWRSTGFYFMDDWKVNRKLTLNVGLRWETIGGLTEVAQRQSALDFGKPNPGAGNRPGALVFLEDLGRSSFQDRYWFQMSPKFGFAYAWTKKLVMRGGYGINNTPPISNGFGFPGTNGYNGSINVNSNTVPLQFAEQQVMFLKDPFPSFQATLPNKSPTLSNGQGVTYIAKDSNRLAYVQNWTLGFQYELPRSFVMELNYVGNKGTRLEAPGLDNLDALPASILSMGQVLTDPWTAASGVPQPFPGFTGTVLQALRPYPQFTGINNSVFAYFGTSNYNAMQLQLTRHFSKGLAVLAAYTWSKTTGLDASALDAITPADVFNRGLERGITRFNYPQFLKVTWIYELPIGPNKLINLQGLPGKILGGWQITGNHQVRSGTPLSITGGPQTSPLGAARLDQVLGQEIVINPDAPISFRGFTGGIPYLNKAAFAPPPVSPGGRNQIARLGTLGPILPNIRGPYNLGEDLGIWKLFHFDEQRTLELRGVFLNPFNRVGRGDPVTDLSSPFFGQITGQQRGGRNIELSARVTF
jgi:hypothetical protein